MARFSGLFVAALVGSVVRPIAVMDDGTFAAKDGTPCSVVLDLDTVYATLREVYISQATAQSTRLVVSPGGVVSAARIEYPTVSGKGSGTLRELIVRRCGTKAAGIIAAIETASAELSAAA